MQIFIVIGLCSEHIWMVNMVCFQEAFCVIFDPCSVQLFTKEKELTYTKHNWVRHANLGKTQSSKYRLSSKMGEGVTVKGLNYSVFLIAQPPFKAQAG